MSKVINPFLSTVDVAHGGTGATTAAGARTNLSAAASGANSDITSLSSLSTPLSIAQGGTNAITQSAAANSILPTQPTNVAKVPLVSDGTNVSFQSHLNSITIFDDMTAGNQVVSPATIGPFGLIPTQNAGGGPVPMSSLSLSTAGRWGLYGIGTGTNSNNNGMGILFSDLAQYYCGQAQTLTLEFCIGTPAALADVTNDYVMELGFRNKLSVGLANNAIAILYQRSSSVNWQAYTANAGTTTIVTSSTAVAANTFYNFRIVITATAVSFYLSTSGPATTLIGTSTTNLPSSSQTTYMNFTIYRASTFALQRAFAIDWIKLDADFASSR